MDIELPKISLPTTTLCCNGNCSSNCTSVIDQYYLDIIDCLTVSANKCVPVKKSRLQKHWWSDKLDELKQAITDATNLWRSVGGPRSGVVNKNRLQYKYRYKKTIEDAINNADKIFSDELFDHFYRAACNADAV